MNRLTAIGLASLVAYGMLLATKYTGFVSAAREEKSSVGLDDGSIAGSAVIGMVAPEPEATRVKLPPPLPRTEQMRAQMLPDLRWLAHQRVRHRSVVGQGDADVSVETAKRRQQSMHRLRALHDAGRPLGHRARGCGGVEATARPLDAGDTDTMVAAYLS